MSNLKETEAEAFRKWFSAQRTYSSLSAMERALNITTDYLHLIRDGTRRATSPELRRKLQEATGLKAFDPVTNASETPISVVANTKQTQRFKGTSDRQKERSVPEGLPILLESAAKKLGLTMEECSEEYKIKLDALKKYRSGVRRPASEKNITAVLRILDDTGVVAAEESHPEKAGTHELPVDTEALTREVRGLREKVDQMDAKLTAARIYQEMGKKATSTNAGEKARTVMRLLMSLSGELEFFKNCTEDERRIFRNTVPGQDVGYITTLLRALYDEDKFQKWLFFSTYTMKGKSGGE